MARKPKIPNKIGPDRWKRGRDAGKLKVITFYGNKTCKHHGDVKSLHDELGFLGFYRYALSRPGCVRCALEKQSLTEAQYKVEVTSIEFHI